MDILNSTNYDYKDKAIKQAQISAESRTSQTRPDHSVQGTTPTPSPAGPVTPPESAEARASTANQMIMKALAASGLPASEKNRTLVMELLKHQLPVDKQTLQMFARLTATNRNASPLTLILLYKNQIPITPANIRQFDAYQYGSHQLLKDIQSLSKGILELLKSLQEVQKSDAPTKAAEPSGIAFIQTEGSVNQSTATAVGQSGSDTAVTTMGSSNSDGTAFGSSLTNPDGTATASGHVNPDITAPASDLSGSASATASLSGSDSATTTTGSTNPDGAASGSGLTNPDGTATVSGHANSDITATASDLSGSASATASLSGSDSANAASGSTNPDGTASGSGLTYPDDSATATGSTNPDGTASASGLTNSESATAASALSGITTGIIDTGSVAGGPNAHIESPVAASDVLKWLSDALAAYPDQADLLPEGALPERSHEFLSHIERQLRQKWTLTPEQLANKQSLKELYQRLEEDLHKLEELIRYQKDTTEILQAKEPVRSLQDNLQFMKDLSHLFSYIQLPLRFTDHEVHGEFYVFNKKNALQGKKDILSVLLHLDMTELGAINVHMKLERNQIQATFAVEAEEAGNIIHAHLPELIDSLTRKGYQLQARVEKQEHPQVLMKEFLEQDPSGNAIKTFSFDIRA